MIPLPPLATLRLIGAGLALAMAAGAGWTLQGWRLGGQLGQQRAEVARVKAEHAQAVASAASAALAQSEANRRTEAGWQQRLKESEDARTTDRAALVAARTAADRHAVGLRQQLDAISCAAAASGAAGDSTAAKRPAAASLGELLEPVLRDYRAAVDAAESHAADLRSVLRAWPVMP